MDKLEVSHHNIITIIIILLVFITGISFGVKLDAATQGTDGMAIITFALCFLAILLLFLNFTQLVHVRDDIKTLHEEHAELKKGNIGKQAKR